MSAGDCSDATGAEVGVAGIYVGRGDRCRCRSRRRADDKIGQAVADGITQAGHRQGALVVAGGLAADLKAVGTIECRELQRAAGAEVGLAEHDIGRSGVAAVGSAKGDPMLGSARPSPFTSPSWATSE
ncbi:MAG: hypothetical protein U1F68_00270 [Gammaproteobacteria bacterium]